MKDKIETINETINETSNETNGEKENYDYVICKICGEKVKRVYGSHLKTHNKTIAEYRKEFPDALITCQHDKENTTKNSGKHMKEEKYRKMFSEKWKGEKNCNHSSHTTKEQRQAVSPFSKKFYEKRNLTEEDRTKFIKKISKDRANNTTLEYYIKKGYSEEEAKILLKDRQTTFSLEKCIKKYGPKEGLEKWKARQEKWLKHYTHSNYSKVSQILFKQIYENIHENFKHIYFATSDGDKRNNEYRLVLDKQVIMPDFFIEDSKKIIEFDGVYWHKNNPENKKRQKTRDKLILENGYQLLHVREDKYYKDPNKVLNQCIEFIYS